jgi:hypothetical protein
MLELLVILPVLYNVFYWESLLKVFLNLYDYLNS